MLIFAFRRQVSHAGANLWMLKVEPVPFDICHLEHLLPWAGILTPSPFCSFQNRTTQTDKHSKPTDSCPHLGRLRILSRHTGTSLLILYCSSSFNKMGPTISIFFQPAPPFSLLFQNSSSHILGSWLSPLDHVTRPGSITECMALVTRSCQWFDHSLFAHVGTKEDMQDTSHDRRQITTLQT